MFETHGDRKFWHVFYRKLPKAAKFERLGVSLHRDISAVNSEEKYNCTFNKWGCNKYQWL